MVLPPNPPDILRGEDRWFRFLIGTLGAGASAGSYELQIRSKALGANTITVAFGSSEFDDGWDVLVPSSETLRLAPQSVAEVYVWRVGNGIRAMVAAFTLRVA
jgi:hypothetical protein